MDKIKKLKYILQNRTKKNLETDAVACSPNQNNDVDINNLNLSSSSSSLMLQQQNYDSLNNSMVPSSNNSLENSNNIRIGNTNIINGENVPNHNNQLTNANIRFNLNNNPENQQLIMAENNNQITSNIHANNMGITNVDGQNVMVFDRCQNFQIGNKVCVRSKNTEKLKSNKNKNINKSNRKQSDSSNDDRYRIDIELDGPILDDMRNSIDLIINTTTYEKFLSGLSKNFTTNYQSILRDLDIEQDIIDGKRMDYHMFSTTEIIFQILLDWARNEENATWNTLTELFMMHKKKKCIRYMIDYWRDRIHPGRYPLNSSQNQTESNTLPEQQNINFKQDVKCDLKSEKIS